MAKPLDLTGQQFGQLTAIEWTGQSDWYGRTWLCHCDCGGDKVVTTAHLRRGSVTSCGCTWSDNRLATLTTHGMNGTTEFNIWFGMRQRCMSFNSKDFKNYGGRGIKVCDAWAERDGFVQFYADMGPRPEGLSLDRIDNDGHYEPGNCRWADDLTQANNRRVTKSVTKLAASF